MDDTCVYMDGVREYCDGEPVALVEAENGRLAVRAWNECRNNITDVDLLDVIAWVRANRPELLGEP
jgi:hypothetical protein